MLNYIKLTDARHGHFLHLDHIQLPLALQFKPLNGATISGILFLPSIHYRHYWKTKFTISEKLTNFRKRIFYSAMLSNSCLRVIFSLDPYFQRYALTHLPHGRKICELPDPSLFPVEKSISKKALPAHFQSIPNSRKIFLIFGMLDKRKGIFKVLEAMNYLDDITLKKIAIIFAGRLAHSIREEFYQIFEETSYRIKALHLQLEDRYIPEEELIQTIRASDVILAPYQRFTGSSGILLWAAGANKPIITQDHGVIGALTKKYKLGLSIDTTDPKEVANALTSIIESDLIDVGDKSKMNNFVANKSSKTFAYTILRKILNEIPETEN
jgi:glycosyltransferase involved in cell wall biosynthesis